ncbi:MAG: SCP2 sterol-binding domain-containing protein [Spirosomataceae bacterium]
MTAQEFISGLPAKIATQGSSDIQTVIHFDLGSEQYSLSVQGTQAEVQSGLVGEPEVTLKATAEDLVKIATGDLNPMTAMMFGKLKISNPAAMMKYAKMLGLM